MLAPYVRVLQATENYTHRPRGCTGDSVHTRCFTTRNAGTLKAGSRLGWLRGCMVFWPLPGRILKRSPGSSYAPHRELCTSISGYLGTPRHSHPRPAPTSTPLWASGRAPILPRSPRAPSPGRLPAWPPTPAPAHSPLRPPSSPPFLPSTSPLSGVASAALE